jgi:hypothetical protein
MAESAAENLAWQQRNEELREQLRETRGQLREVNMEAEYARRHNAELLRELNRLRYGPEPSQQPPLPESPAAVQSILEHRLRRALMAMPVPWALTLLLRFELTDWPGRRDEAWSAHAEAELLGNLLPPPGGQAGVHWPTVETVRQWEARGLRTLLGQRWRLYAPLARLPGYDGPYAALVLAVLGSPTMAEASARAAARLDEGYRLLAGRIVNG